MKITLFWAQWCAPSRRVKKQIELVAKKHQLEAEYIDVAEDPLDAHKADVRWFPTFVLYGDSGEELGRQYGYKRAEDIEWWITKDLGVMFAQPSTRFEQR